MDPIVHRVAKSQTWLSMSWDSLGGGGPGAEIAVICVPNGTHSLKFDAFPFPLVSIPGSFTELKAQYIPSRDSQVDTHSLPLDKMQEILPCPANR